MDIKPTYPYGDLYVNDTAKVRFFHLVMENDLRYVQFKCVESNELPEKLLEALGIRVPEDVEISLESTGNHWIVAWLAETGILSYIHIMVQADKRQYAVHIASKDHTTATEYMAKATKALPKPVIEKDSTIVPVSFWSMTSTGPTAFQRLIETPRWPDIRENYPEKLRGHMDALMDAEPPFDGGRLILWHGPPGTGKTTSLRSLIHKWSDWCSPQYVVDPERFFGESSYMMTVLLADTDDHDLHPSFLDTMDDEDELMEAMDTEEEDNPRWKLLIAEDADEFLGQDARLQSGQALSRLLNLADGMVGQGLKLLILITTNAELGSIHPAVKREGRCAANMHFGNFTAMEAAKWMDLHQIDGPAPSNSMTLAQLYELTRKSQINGDRPRPSTGLYL